MAGHLPGVAELDRVHPFGLVASAGRRESQSVRLGDTGPACIDRIDAGPESYVTKIDPRRLGQLIPWHIGDGVVNCGKSEYHNQHN
jgi:hypothetical protein